MNATGISVDWLNFYQLRRERIIVLQCLVLLFYETSGLSLLLGKPAQREGARTGLELLCEVLHPTLSRPERPDHNTGSFTSHRIMNIEGL